MEWIQLSVNTLIPQIPSIINKNNVAFKSYLDVFYNETSGIIIKPVETTGKIKGGNGEFINLVVDNLTVKNQYTNLHSNITTADYEYYTTYVGNSIIPRDASVTSAIYENPLYKYIDVNKPYYKVSNTNRIALKSSNLSQLVHLMFDTSTALLNDYIVQLNPATNETFQLTVKEAQTTWAEFIMIDYDTSWGSYWSVYKYGTLDASVFDAIDASRSNINIGISNQIPYVNAISKDFAYSTRLSWDGMRMVINASTGTDNIFVGTNSGKIGNSGVGNIGLGRDTGQSLTAGTKDIFIGYQAGKVNTTGSNDTFIGYNAGVGNTTGNDNTFIGYQSGLFNISGKNNTFIGSLSGVNSSTNENVFIGYGAGYYETDSSILLIDNQIRASKALAKTGSLFYGQFNINPNNQLVRINSTVELPRIPLNNLLDNVVYIEPSSGRLSYGAINNSILYAAVNYTTLSMSDPSIFWDCSTGLYKTLTLSGNRSLVFSNTQSGMRGDLKLTCSSINTLTLPAGSIKCPSIGAFNNMSGVYHISFIIVDSSMSFKIDKYF